MLSRRGLLIASAATAAAGLASPLRADPAADFASIEKAAGGRLGLCAMTADRSKGVDWRSGERFLMCSTFKALAVSAVLARVDRGQEHLDRVIPYGQADLQEYAPVTKANLTKGGMALGDLCAAAVELSDNTAANLIIAALGGPSGVTGYVRSLGDNTTRLDRNEPTLNRPGPPGDEHDTTTPQSMVGLWRQLVLGDALSSASRDRLNGWLEACQTGAERIKSVTPKGWKIGHKTGWGQNTLGDVAVLTPPNGPQILIAAYFEQPDALSHPHDEAIAEAARIALRFLTSNA
ncbi:class A beta-lactamase [Phenylobacterium montanum]|uniref:beta-lactamase n=1 Tax=Phenylobacterium montanum TaxID=2823693 RepID=A0A975G4T0_9CAUL|nr:class A beta-lactamase [Caulobacter sp. S6]QUD90041.1 class A beta-lactamase [Caulobacter sp. S6]